MKVDPDALTAQTGKASALLGAMSNRKRLMILCQRVLDSHSINIFQVRGVRTL